MPWTQLRRKNVLSKKIHKAARMTWAKFSGIGLKTSLIGLVFSFLVMPVTHAGLFNPETFTLPNGLQVIVLTNNRAPIVKQIVVYKVGSIDEPKGKSGIAHFLEHLMFKGTSNISRQELDKENDRMGADQNAQTGYNYTTYFQEVVKQDLPRIMKLESDRMVNLLLDEKDVESERPVILEERRMRTDNEPGAILEEAIHAALYRHHPYRIPIIGWEHEIEGLNQADAKDFYKTWYVPNNAILVLAGDITLAEAKELATKYYGPIASKPLPGRNITKEPDHRDVNLHVEKKSSRVLEPVYHKIFGAPNLREDIKATYALQVLEQILAKGANSILFDRLVTKNKIASWVSASYSGSISRGPALFRFSAQPAPGKSLEAVEGAISKEVELILQKGVTAEQVEKAKKRMVADIDYIKDDSFGSADIFAYIIGCGFEIKDVEEWKERVEVVTAEDVNAAARAVFSQKDFLTAHLLPEPQEGK